MSIDQAVYLIASMAAAFGLKELLARVAPKLFTGRARREREAALSAREEKVFQALLGIATEATARNEKIIRENAELRTQVSHLEREVEKLRTEVARLSRSSSG